MGRAVGLFVIGGFVSVIGSFLSTAAQRWLALRRERTGKESKKDPERGRDAPVSEPSLAELLAEAGWRINPKHRDRELARRLIPLGIIGLLALLCFMAGSSLGWLLLGLVTGWSLATTLRGMIQ